MAKMTKAQIATHHNLQTMVFAQSDKVFSVVERTDVPFMTCYAAAPMELRMAHDKAKNDLDAFERDMIAKGRGWRNANGHFQRNT